MNNIQAVHTQVVEGKLLVSSKNYSLTVHHQDHEAHRVILQRTKTTHVPSNNGFYLSDPDEFDEIQDLLERTKIHLLDEGISFNQRRS